MTEYTVNFTWDEEAQVWVAVGEGFGLVLEHNSLDMLMERVRLAAPELIELRQASTQHISLNFNAHRVEELRAYG